MAAGVKYTFVTAIEACVDVAQHICATEGWGPPTDNGDAVRLRHYVQALVHPVDEVHVGVAGRAEEHRVARRAACGSVRRGIAIADVRLHLHEASNQQSLGCPANKQLTQNRACNGVRRPLEEGARHQPAGRGPVIRNFARSFAGHERAVAWLHPWISS